MAKRSRKSPKITCGGLFWLLIILAVLAVVSIFSRPSGSGSQNNTRQQELIDTDTPSDTPSNPELTQLKRTAIMTTRTKSASSAAATYYAIETATAFLANPTLTAPTRRANQPTRIPAVATRVPAQATIAPIVQNQSIPSTSSENSCPSMSATCGQLTCQQAYACLAAGNGRLDNDGDGVPCESICSGG